MDFHFESNYHPEFTPPRFDPAAIYIEAHQNPDRFWQLNRDAIQKGFQRKAFVNPDEDATTAIVIPSHNEDSGSKKGNIRACLYAISQLQIPDKTSVKVVVIGHNNNIDDSTEELMRTIGVNIEYVRYNTPLRSFSYPLQVAPFILRDQEVQEIGIVDADTVVNHQWLRSNREFLRTSEDVIAVAGPRTYLDNQGKSVPYGSVKVRLEQGLSALQKAFPSRQLPFVKLVSGNSYYRFHPLKKTMQEILGRAVTDGLIQQNLRNGGGRIANNPGAWGVSNGEKFTYASGIFLPTVVAKKTRVIVKPTMQDHIDFLEVELPSYFPDYGQQLSLIKEDLVELVQPEKLKRLMGVLTQYEDKTRVQLQKDIERLRSHRARSSQ